MASQKPENRSKQPAISGKRSAKTWLLATGNWLRHAWHAVLPKNKWLRRSLLAFIIIILGFLGTAYGIARWYMYTQRNVPYTMGVSFIPDYAAFLGLNPQKTMTALIDDLHVKHFRLTSYWSDIEPTKGHYDFSQLDWEFAKADAAHATVTLSIGLRQPRWPECHAPNWVNTSAPQSQWQPELEQFITAVINRYKNNPALQSYQLENEYFNTFGQCHNASRSRLVSEFQLVKRLDAQHPVIISRSNNYGGLQLGAPQPDEFGISIYRRVWVSALHRYVEYPFPAWYYAFLAGAQKILTGKVSIIHELQAEPWTPDGKTIPQTSLAEQNKSLNASSLQQNINFAHATGIRTVYFWGAEYWYYRKTVLHDPSVWNVAKQNFTAQN